MRGNGNDGTDNDNHTTAHFYTLTHSIPVTTLLGKNWYYPHFTDDKTEEE